MTILVIGTGLLGANVLRKFAAEGYDVIGLDLYPPRVDFLKEKGIRILPGDIRDFPLLSDVIDRFKVEGIINAVMHQSLNEYTSFQITAYGTANVLELAKRRNLRVVNISTGVVYMARPRQLEDMLRKIKEDELSFWEESIHPPVENTDTGCYVAMKRMGEQLAVLYNMISGVDSVTIRPSWIWGPGPLSHYQLTRLSVLLFLSKALAGETYTQPTGGDWKADYTYVKDLANGVFLAYTVRPIKHRVFNMSGGKLVSLREEAEAVLKAVPGSKIEIGPGTDPKARSPFGPYPALDISRAQEELGYRPEYTIETGMMEYAKWMKK
jgi:UDP-glucose 4-epimerase